MPLRINDIAPDFETETTEGAIRLHDGIDDGWAILLSHPKDFTPVRTTELRLTAGLAPGFEKRGARILGSRSIRKRAISAGGPQSRTSPAGSSPIR